MRNAGGWSAVGLGRASQLNDETELGQNAWNESHGKAVRAPKMRDFSFFLKDGRKITNTRVEPDNFAAGKHWVCLAQDAKVR